MNLAYVELTVQDTRKAAYVLSDKLGLTNFKIGEGGQIRIYENQVSLQALSKELALHDVPVSKNKKKAETLEDYFLKITGEVKADAETN